MHGFLTVDCLIHLLIPESPLQGVTAARDSRDSGGSQIGRLVHRDSQPCWLGSLDSKALSTVPSRNHGRNHGRCWPQFTTIYGNLWSGLVRQCSLQLSSDVETPSPSLSSKCKQNSILVGGLSPCASSCYLMFIHLSARE